MKKLLFIISFLGLMLVTTKGWCPPPPGPGGMTAAQLNTIIWPTPVSLGTKTTAATWALQNQIAVLTDATQCTITLADTTDRYSKFTVITSPSQTATVAFSGNVNTHFAVDLTKYPANYAVTIYDEWDGTNHTLSLGTLPPNYSFYTDQYGNLIPVNVRLASFHDDGGGSAITNFTTGCCLNLPLGGTITGWELTSGPTSGSVTVDILQGNDASSLTSLVGTGTKPALSSQYKASGTPADWTGTATLISGGVVCITTTNSASMKQMHLTLYGHY